MALSRTTSAARGRSQTSLLSDRRPLLPLRAAHRAALARDARHHPHQSVGLRAHDLERGRGDAQAHPQADDSAIHECGIYARTPLSIASAAGALTTGCVCAWRAVSWLVATGRGRGARAVAALAGSHQLPLKSRARVRTFSYDYNLHYRSSSVPSTLHPLAARQPTEMQCSLRCRCSRVVQPLRLRAARRPFQRHKRISDR